MLTKHPDDRYVGCTSLSLCTNINIISLIELFEIDNTMTKAEEGLGLGLTTYFLLNETKT